MSGKSVLLEIGVEEIPARFLPGAMVSIKSLAETKLEENRIGFEKITTNATPRRIAVHIEGISESQEESEHEAFGPPVKAAFDKDGNPTKAAEGFARSHGVRPEELKVRKKGKGEYVVAEVREKGLPTEEVLPAVLKDIVLSLHFPKSMRWGDGTIRFVRPIRWILAVYDGKTVDFEVEGMKSGNMTYGHRFLSDGALLVEDIDNYPRLLEDNCVMLNKAVRERMIWEQATGLASSVGGVPVKDDELLSIVACLVEYPVAVLGSFSGDYLELPDELLIAVMKGHQKYFSVAGADGSLINHFIVVSNTRAENADTVRVGAERVIKARFDDARFYFQEDRKSKLAEMVEELKRVTYHEKLGTLYDKTIRLKEITVTLSKAICPDKKDKCLRAAELAKADLISGVVFEFPELQGVMGKYYARNDGEGDEVAQALEEQYLPAFSGDEPPESDVGAVLSLADRIDTIAAFFSIGLRPSGSEDPFALRRHALSAIAILEGKGYGMSIQDLLSCGSKVSPDDERIKVANDVGKEIITFFEQRIEQLLLGRGYDHDVVQSVLPLSTTVPPADLGARIETMKTFKAHPEYNTFLLAVKRVRNITPEGELPEVNEKLFQEDAERELKGSLDSVSTKARGLMDKGKYPEAIEAFIGLKGPINLFFDQVLVMDKDESLKNNRLALLREIWGLVSSLADFSKLQEAAGAPEQ